MCFRWASKFNWHNTINYQHTKYTTSHSSYKIDRFVLLLFLHFSWFSSSVLSFHHHFFHAERERERERCCCRCVLSFFFVYFCSVELSRFWFFFRYCLGRPSACLPITTQLLLLLPPRCCRSKPSYDDTIMIYAIHTERWFFLRHFFFATVFICA